MDSGLAEIQDGTIVPRPHHHIRGGGEERPQTGNQLKFKTQWVRNYFARAARFFAPFTVLFTRNRRPFKRMNPVASS